jgi:hypothetical protein
MVRKRNDNDFLFVKLLNFYLVNVLLLFSLNTVNSRFTILSTICWVKNEYNVFLLRMTAWDPMIYINRSIRL